MTVCFRVIGDFMVSFSTDRNCRVKALENTINLFGKYNLKSLIIKKLLKAVIISDSEQKILKASMWACSGSEFIRSWKVILAGS